MKTDALIDALGAENLAEFTTSAPIGAESAGLDVFNELFKAAGGDQTAVYATTSYDATFLLALAVEEAGAADRSKISEEIGRAHVCTPVTNAHLVCRLLLAKKTE